MCWFIKLTYFLLSLNPAYDKIVLMIKLEAGIQMNLKEKVKALPSLPGVYLMKDANSRIIYVGKAKNLKKRVPAYFQNSKTRSSKIERLTASIKDFDFILTDTEFEAFMLECKLIKEIKPFFNKRMKNQQSYTYIRINTEEPYPSLELADTPDDNSKHLFFGPYINKHTVIKAIQGIKEFFKISCSNPSGKNSLCLNYSLGLCLGICNGSLTIERYQKIIENITSLLTGTLLGPIEEMTQQMQDAADRFDYKLAGKLKGNIDAINSLIYKENVIDFTEDNQNIAVIEVLDSSSIKLFLIKGNKILYSEKHILNSTKAGLLIDKIKKAILSHFKIHFTQSTIAVSKDDIDEAQIIYSYLRSNNCKYIIIPDHWLETEPGTLNKAIAELVPGYNKLQVFH